MTAQVQPDAAATCSPDTAVVVSQGRPSTRRLLHRALADTTVPIRIKVYDGTAVGPADAQVTLRINSPSFFRRIALHGVTELAFARSFALGEIDVDGDIYQLLQLRNAISRASPDRSVLGDLLEILEVDSLQDFRRLLTRVRTPPEEIRTYGLIHSRRRDAAAIASHYDVSNDFYRVFLGPSMTYSCAYFRQPNQSVDDAQREKFDLIAAKLDLRRGKRLLDIGCGWGELVMHAAREYGVAAVGVTISRAQMELARDRVGRAGLSDLVDIRLQDYRDIGNETFDAISSIGMFEHVGKRCAHTYLREVHRLLADQGRFLNQAISRPDPDARTEVDPKGLIGRFVFPDGELLEVGCVISAMTRAGLEVRHVESMREHYAMTLRHWVQALEDNWDIAVRHSSEGRSRIWRLYMAACALGFETNEFGVNQIVAIKSIEGNSGLKDFSRSPSGLFG